MSAISIRRGVLPATANQPMLVRWRALATSPGRNPSPLSMSRKRLTGVTSAPVAPRGVSV
jgi:hypothetical protein